MRPAQALPFSCWLGGTVSTMSARSTAWTAGREWDGDALVSRRKMADMPQAMCTCVDRLRDEPFD